MEIVTYPPKKDWEALLARPGSAEPALENKVREIINEVKTGGDRALKKYARLFDGTVEETLELDKNLWETIALDLDEKLKKAIGVSINNIKKFHKNQVSETPAVETVPGVRCWQKHTPIERIGLYIPGGTAPLISTLIMLAVPANVAGCKEIFVCTPVPAGRKIHPAIPYIAGLTGVKKIFRIGGAQAIAAMAYGTETIPKVSKIFGPGNKFVTEAKKQISSSGTAIDLPAGPSELMIYADDTAVPEFIAADLLSQAEHGPDSQVLLVSTSEQVIKETIKALRIQLETLPRKNFAVQSLKFAKAIQAGGPGEAIDLINYYAPEHLIISTKTADEDAQKITACGSVFLGNYTPESAGDYASGTNHTLPTGGYAKAYSGVTTDSFMKKISFQKISRNGLLSLSETIENLAKAENLEAHARAVSIRLK